MPSFVVMMQLGYEQRPTRGDQAFLGGLDARVQPLGIADLQVVIDVDAPDMGAALTRAQELVVERLGGDLHSARVVAAAYEARPGSLWDRLKRRS
jgi:hypothetical protein